MMGKVLWVSMSDSKDVGSAGVVSPCAAATVAYLRSVEVLRVHVGFGMLLLVAVWFSWVGYLGDCCGLVHILKAHLR